MPPQHLDAGAIARVGTTLNQKYRLERLIGAGGMASVYEAVHRNGHRVAIKVLHANLSLDAELRARFLREGYVANKVNHRGAVRVLDDDAAEDGAVFLVMELLEGETLDARWRRSGQPLAVREVCELASQLLQVLAAAHDAGVVHRDIKPENIFLTTESVLKVLDFGIARLRDGATSQSSTRTGRMIGTPAFMPPEQALGRSRQIDAQTDLWAAGATMFTLLSGHYVHEAETVEEMLVFAGSRPARSVLVTSPLVPGEIASVIDRALAFQQSDRWPDARAMNAALGDAYHREYGSRVPSSSDARPVASGGGGAERVSSRPGGAGFAANAMTPPSKGESTTAGLSGPKVGLVLAPPAAAAPGRKHGRAALWIALGALAVAGGAGLGATMLGLRTRGNPSSIVSVSADPQATATLSPPPSTVSASALVTVPVAPVLSGVAAESLDAGRSGVTTTKAVHPSALPPAHTGKPPSPPPPATPPPAPSCRIAKEYDSEGNVHFKQICN